MFEKFFKALGEPTRLKIIKLLGERDLCVCDLEEIMQISQPRISQHLKVLKQAELVRERKEGQRTICTLNKVILEATLREFMSYIAKPAGDISELKEEYMRLNTTIPGAACNQK